MLSEERKQQICNYVNTQNAVTVQELIENLGASEATIRRDLNELHRRGLLLKVRGGAVALTRQIKSDDTIAARQDMNQKEKVAIARYAATLIQPNDLVFLDAGTTTSYLIDYLDVANVTFVTNAIIHAKKLSSKNYPVYLTGGQLKSTTEALIGAQCYSDLQRYQFSIGFFGTNAVNHTDGFTTPDPEEAKIKECAITHTLAPYVLCDHSKFDLTAPVRFADYQQACIITAGNTPNAYRKDPTIIQLS